MRNGNKIAEKSEKNWGMVGMMVGNVCRVQSPCLNIVIYSKIAKKWPKNKEKLGEGGDNGG